MKSAFVIVIAAVVLTACSTPDKSKPKYNIVYEPERGVVCDRIEQACYDGDGPAVAATKKYLGPEAAEEFQRKVATVGADNMRSIEFSDRVYCSYKTQLCKKSRYSNDVAPHHTKALFGEY